MEKRKLYVSFGMMIGAAALLSIPVQSASAGTQRGFYVSIAGYHGGGHRIWDHYDSSKKSKRNRQYHKHKKVRVKPRTHYHDYKHHGFVTSLPYRTKRIRVNGIAYQYHDGIFYRKCKRGFDIVSAPAGAFVQYLPSRAKRSHTYGRKYYYHPDGETYYKKTRRGYKVVEKPHDKLSYHNSGHIDHYAYSGKGKYCTKR